MAPRVEALVEASLLVWARRSAGLDLETAARKVPVTPERLAGWERGDGRPTIGQLRKLAGAYKRPLAVFYLPEPPTEFQALRDFRRLAGEAPSSESSQLLFQVRLAQDRREIAQELYEASEGEAPAFSLTATGTEDAEGLGEHLRKFINLHDEDQERWAPGYETLNALRAKFENAGVLVFQATDVPVAEMRAFCIYSERMPAVVLNVKDAISGRVFSLFHELTHLALRQWGLCSVSPEELTRATTDDQRIEQYCNRVAGAALVPRERLLGEHLLRSSVSPASWSDVEIRHLADGYGVSREVVLRRLLLFDVISESYFQTKIRQFHDEYARQASSREGGFAPPHRMALASAGPAFVRLVLASYSQDRITASDVAGFLGIRLKHLPRIERDLLRSAS
jgi:Zn-dependent peptidase ImmA (M78 family)